MYPSFSDDGEESNTAKGLNIATEFNEFREILFNKKVVRHKMKSTKYHYLFLMIKDFF